MNKLSARLSVPSSSATPTGGAPVVLRGAQLAGYRTLYAHGHVVDPVTVIPTPPRSTRFQPLTNFLTAARFNDFLFRAGGRALMAPNTGLSFKGHQLPKAQQGTKPTMRPAPRFTATQRLRRAPTAPPVVIPRSSA